MADAENAKIHSNSGIYTCDGTVDLKGRPFLRAKGGGWTACSFLIVSELFDRLAFFGIQTNLVMYLAKEMHQSAITSAKNVSNWMGAQMMLTILGASIGDAYLGRYLTIILSSSLYFLGMCMLTVIVWLQSQKSSQLCISSNIKECNDGIPSNKILSVLFFCSLYIIALGNGGRRPNATSLGASQFDIFYPKENLQKPSFFNWWSSVLFIGALFSSTVLVYIQDKLSWVLGYIMATVSLGFSMLIFMSGTPFYRHKMPFGSPFKRIAIVLVSSFRKYSVSVPNNDTELHEFDSKYYLEERKFKINHTNVLRFLDKAAVRSGLDECSPWMLCTITQVEETKQIIKLLPVFIVTIIPNVMKSLVQTLFVSQGIVLDRRVGQNFEIPPASLISFNSIAYLVAAVIYDRWLVPVIRKRTKNPRGITMLWRIGIGLWLHVIIMIMAALIERQILRMARNRELSYKSTPISLTIFVLVPQFALMGIADVFVLNGRQEFFYDQAPDGLKSLGASLFTSSVGIGNFLSSFLLSTVQKVTTKGGKKEGWLENNLNESHLDYYYLFLATLNVINFMMFIIVAKCYVYNKDSINLSEYSISEI